MFSAYAICVCGPVLEVRIKSISTNVLLTKTLQGLIFSGLRALSQPSSYIAFKISSRAQSMTGVKNGSKPSLNICFPNTQPTDYKLGPGFNRPSHA